MGHEINRIQSKDHNIGLYIISVYDNKNIYLKKDILGCHIFINLLVNYIKLNNLNKDNLF